jgi:hypothetical protein
MLSSFGLAGRAGSIKDEQRVLGIDPDRFACDGLVLHQIVPPEVALPVRLYITTFLTASQPPIAKASSIAGLSAISLLPRIYPSAVTTAVAPASMMRS